MNHFVCVYVQGSDVVMRIVHKKELGCQAMAPVVIKEEVREAVTAKVDKFWSLLGGKKGIKCKCLKNEIFHWRQGLH